MATINCACDMNQGISGIRWEIVPMGKFALHFIFICRHALMSHEPDGRLWTSFAWLKGTS